MTQPLPKDSATFVQINSAPRINDVLLLDFLDIYDKPTYDSAKTSIAKHLHNIVVVLNIIPMKIFHGYCHRRKTDLGWYVKENSPVHKRSEECTQDPKKGMYIRFSRCCTLMCRQIREIGQNEKVHSIQILTSSGTIGWILFDKYEFKRTRVMV